MIDNIKEFATIFTGFTGLLIAFLSGFFFKKNKQTEYSMKLAEIAIEKVYNRVLVFIEDNIYHSDGYEGLTFDEVQKIKNMFLEHRHLVDDVLWDMIWRFEENEINRQEYLYFNNIRIDAKDKEYMYDQDREFLERLTFVRNKHLKNLGFSTHVKPNVYEKLMMAYKKLQNKIRKYRIQKHKKRIYKQSNKK